MKLLLIILPVLFNTSIDFTSPYKELTWRDFNIIKSNDEMAAESVTSISYEYDGYSKVKVSCHFIKSESFVKQSEMTSYILRHEQKHFDITYLFAAKFANELKNQKDLTDALVESIYDKIIAEKDIFQEKYDNETDHSKNRVMQAIWNKKIDVLLNNL